MGNRTHLAQLGFRGVHGLRVPLSNLKGARVYVTLFPCNECTKAIIQYGIAEVVYYGDKYHDSDSSIAARFMFQKAGVKLTPYTPSGRKAELEL